MKICALAIISATVAGAPAWAMSDLERIGLATELGTVLASEETCGLSYDQSAIEQFVQTRVPADDMEFAPMLHTMTSGTGYNIGQMSESSKTAHCTQMRRVAKSYGFTK